MFCQIDGFCMQDRKTQDSCKILFWTSQNFIIFVFYVKKREVEGSVAHQDRAQDSYSRLGASLETVNVELLKVGETCQMAIPSQAPKGEGVETKRAASKGSYFLW